MNRKEQINDADLDAAAMAYRTAHTTSGEMDSEDVGLADAFEAGAEWQKRRVILKSLLTGNTAGGRRLEVEIIRYKVPFVNDTENLDGRTLDAIAGHFYRLALTDALAWLRKNANKYIVDAGIGCDQHEFIVGGRCWEDLVGHLFSPSPDDSEDQDLGVDNAARHYLLHEHRSPLSAVMHEADLKAEMTYHKDIEKAFKAGVKWRNDHPIVK